MNRKLNGGMLAVIFALTTTGSATYTTDYSQTTGESTIGVIYNLRDSATDITTTVVSSTTDPTFSEVTTSTQYESGQTEASKETDYLTRQTELITNANRATLTTGPTWAERERQTG